MSKKKQRVWEKLEKIPERFKSVLGEGEYLYFVVSLLNETAPPEKEGYLHFGTGDNGFYYKKI